MKKICTLLIAIFILLGSTEVFASSDFAGGRGTVDDPYLIANEKQLDCVRNYLEYHFRLEADIDCSSFEKWKPIGSMSEPFTGTFDGNSFTVSGLNNALFSLNDGIIQNLTIEDDNRVNNGTVYMSFVYYSGCIAAKNTGSVIHCSCNQTISDPSIYSSTLYIGGIVGLNESGTIENCEFNGKIALSDYCDRGDYLKNKYIGGIVGSSTQGEIKKCNNYGTISIYGNLKNYIGGICGSTDSAIIKECTNSGILTYKNTNYDFGDSADYIGGIVGKFGVSSQIIKCNNDTNINVSVNRDYDSFSYVGGLAGSCNGTITSSTNNGTVSSRTSVSNSYAPDFVSCSGGVIGIYYGGKITDCLNTAKISCRINDGIKSAYSGGIIGKCENNNSSTEKSINHCYNTNEVYVNAPAINASVFAGGIIADNSNGTSIGNCYNWGRVISISTERTNDADCLAISGGLIGKNLNGKIYESYNAGEVQSMSYCNSISGGIVGKNEKEGVIENTFNIANITADVEAYSYNIQIYSGGLAGYNEGTVTESYNTGSCFANKSIGVTDANNVISEVCAGGLIGYQNGIDMIVSSCYYKDVMSSGYGNKKDKHQKYSFSQMMRESSFADFDFVDTWTMQGNEDYLLPELTGIEMIYPKMESVTLISKPEKLTYIEKKDSLDVTGGEVKLVWEDKTEEVIPLEADMVSGFDNSIVGEQELTIKVGSQSTTYFVEILHDYEENVIEPTCTEKGYTEHICSVCDYSFKDQYKEALGHTEVVDKAVMPTCTKPGLTQGMHCSVCNEIFIAQEEVTAKGHTEVIDKAVAPTCSKAGLTEGSHCSVCNTVLTAQKTVAKLPHTEIIDPAVESTCSSTGLTEGSHCSVCGTVITAQKQVSKLPHIVVADQGYDATCTEKGLSNGSHCSVCNEVIQKQSSVSALGHSWDAGQVTKPAVGNQTGVKTYTCTRCGAIKTESIPAPGISIRFIDVPDDAWFASYVYDLVGQGILNGMSETTFEPNGLITRAQFAKILAAASGDDLTAYAGKTSFDDVSTSAWYASYVQWAYEKGVVSGMGNNQFAPDANVTREQMAAMISRYAKYKGVRLSPINAKLTFNDDASISSWAKDNVYAMQQAGIINGYADGNGYIFKPRGNATRAEASKMISVFLTLQ